jgi:membrane protease YdiL (CAAX protease family)
MVKVRLASGAFAPICRQQQPTAGLQPNARSDSSGCDVAFALGCGALLAGYNNVVAAKRWHQRWYALVNLGAAAALLAVAGASGLTASDLGLRRDRLRAGLRLGAMAAGAVTAGWLLAVVLPAARPALRDERVSSLSRREICYQVTVRIPAGTVLWEETAFRGVLLAALRRVVPEVCAVALTSAVFGIWHIRPAREARHLNRAIGDRRAAGPGVTASVAATAAASVLLSSLRVRSGSLAAPVLLHLATNCGGALAAWFARPDPSLTRA